MMNAVPRRAGTGNRAVTCCSLVSSEAPERSHTASYKWPQPVVYKLLHLHSGHLVGAFIQSDLQLLQLLA